MAEVFSGFVAGYTLALLSTPVLAFTLLRLRGSSPLLERLLPPGVSAIGVSVILHGALFFVWSALGIVFGLVLLAMADEGDAAGSRNAPYTLFVIGLTAALLSPIAIAVRPVRIATLTCAVLMVLVFGWLMPYMAAWSAFGDRPSDGPPKPAPERIWYV